MSLRARVALTIVLTQVVVVVAFTLSQLALEERLVTEFLSRSALGYVDCIGHHCAEPLSRADLPALSSVVVAVAAMHAGDVSYVQILDPAGRLLAGTRPATDVLAAPVDGGRASREPPDGSDDVLVEVSAPVVRAGSMLGYVTVGISRAKLSERLWSTWSRSGKMLLGALVIGGLIAVVVDRRLSRSLRLLSQTSIRLAHGDLRQRAEIDTGDELQVLGENLNRMASQLARSHDHLELQVRLRTQQLLQEQEKLRAAVDGLGAGLLLLGPDLEVTWCNPTAMEAFGPAERLMGASFPASVLRSDDPGARARFERVLAGEGLQMEHRIPIEGGARHFVITASPSTRGGARAIVLLQDVTSLKDMEAELLHAGKLAAAGEMAANLAHEVNNPLAVILAHAERMHLLAGRMDLAPEERYSAFPRLIETIVRHSQRCKDLTEKLLGFTRRSSPTTATTDVDRAVRSAIALLQPARRHAGVRVVIQDDLRGAPPVRGDPGALEQVLVNLLLNALQAIDGEGEVRITAVADGARVSIRVSDTGCGIPPEDLSRIFKPFFSTKAGGTGLGLAICQRIVTALGGRLTVESEPGQGTTFTVTLPAGAEGDA